MSNLTEQNFDGSQYIAHGDFVYRHEHVPIIVRSEGSYLYDNFGKKYLDAEASNGACLLGYDRSILTSAINKISQLPSAPSFCETDMRLNLAYKLGSWIEKLTGIKGRVAFDIGGAQGVESAMRVVHSNVSGTLKVLFEGGYHGRSPYTSNLSASLRYRTLLNQHAGNILRIPYPDCEQCRFQKKRIDCHHECVSYVSQLVENEWSGGVESDAIEDKSIAAFVLEPLLSAGGTVWPDNEYVEKTVSIMRRKGALIVVDETFCGLFRTGKPFGFMHYDIVPDIMVFAKGLTNGLVPISCVWARDPLMLPENYVPGTHSATFINNLVAIAAADTVLDRILIDEKLQLRVLQIQEKLGRILKDIEKKFSMVKSSYAKGAVGRLLLHKPVCAEILNAARSINYSAKDTTNGLILSGSGLAKNVVSFSPPLTINDDDLDILHNLLNAVFSKMADHH